MQATIAILFALLSSYLNPQTVYAESVNLIPQSIITSTHLDLETAAWLSNKTAEYAQEYGQDPYTGLDIMYCESKFRNIESKTNDVGPMQINRIHSSEAAEMGLNLDDPADNIHYGFYLMSIHHDLHDWSSSESCWSQHPISGGSREGS